MRWHLCECWTRTCTLCQKRKVFISSKTGGGTYKVDAISACQNISLLPLRFPSPNSYSETSVQAAYCNCVYVCACVCRGMCVLYITLLILQEAKWRPFMLKPVPSPLMKPVLVFVNPKSGGNQVGRYLPSTHEWWRSAMCVLIFLSHRCLNLGEQVAADVHVDTESSAGVWSLPGRAKRRVSLNQHCLAFFAPLPSIILFLKL